jgi:general secretion pathway protein D
MSLKVTTLSKNRSTKNLPSSKLLRKAVLDGSLLLAYLLFAFTSGCSQNQSNIAGQPGANTITAVVNSESDETAPAEINHLDEPNIDTIALSNEAVPASASESEGTISIQSVNAEPVDNTISENAARQQHNAESADLPTASHQDAPAVSSAANTRSKAPEDLPIFPNNPAMADEMISVNFDKVDIRVVLKTISDITGINFVVDESVGGTVTVISPSTIRLGEVYQVLESILDVKGYAAVPAEGVVKIVPRTEAAQHNLHVRIGRDPLQIPRTDSLVTQIIPLSYADAAEVSRIIKPLLAKTSYVATCPRTNSILITDISSNIHQVARIIQELDVQRTTRPNFHVAYLRNAQAGEVAESLTAAMTNLKIAGAIEAATPISVTADEGANALIITSSPQDYEVISEIIDKLDIAREQVLLEMLIMEISRDDLTGIEIDWAALDDTMTDDAGVSSATYFGPRAGFVNGDLEGLDIGTFKLSDTNAKIGTVLAAMEKQKGAGKLSIHHILTTNHRSAKIIVGENIPFVTESRITKTTDFPAPAVIKTFEYRDVGISLTVTPHINRGGLIRLEIEGQFTRLVKGVTGDADAPTTAKRQAQTMVSMESGSTIVISGLLRDDKVAVENKIPFIADIPVIGGLFKFPGDLPQKTNLLIFITPHVLGNRQDLINVAAVKK